MQGWFGGGNARLLERELRGKRLVLELGSWMGLSTTFLAQNAAPATILAVDHWQGSVEHHTDPKFAALVPSLFDCFLQNLWEFRARVVPVRATTWQGMALLAAEGVTPDLVYVDASHEEPDVLRDLQAVGAFFPNAAVVGDDWRWKGVRRAVRRYAKLQGAIIEVDENSWMLHPPGSGYGVGARAANVAKRVEAGLRRAAWPLVRTVRGKRA
ncbi:MAG: class I SAM-dependent methyltransferase [Thermoplasmatota archaeon]